jgi:ferredoxin
MATLFCFSATGNSLYAAKRIAQTISGDIRPMSMSKDPVVCEDDMIGFVFPIFFWGLPRQVESFVSRMEISNKSAYLFAIATCGASLPGVVGCVNKLLKSKGFHLHYGSNLVHLSNYIPVYKIKDNEALRQKVDGKIVKIADEIKNRKIKYVAPPLFINNFAHRFYPQKDCDRHYTIAPTCTGCSTCEKVCPVGNISMESGKPIFKHGCEHCLACLHNCPVQAIDWKGKTQGKDRYRNAGISLAELINLYNTNEE